MFFISREEHGPSWVRLIDDWIATVNDDGRADPDACEGEETARELGGLREGFGPL